MCPVIAAVRWLHETEPLLSRACCATLMIHRATGPGEERRRRRSEERAARREERGDKQRWARVEGVLLGFESHSHAAARTGTARGSRGFFLSWPTTAHIVPRSQIRIPRAVDSFLSLPLSSQRESKDSVHISVGVSIFFHPEPSRQLNTNRVAIATERFLKLQLTRSDSTDPNG